MRATLVLIAGLLLSGCLISRVAQSEIQGRGHALFNGYLNPKADCYRCHGGNAQGGLTGPNLEVVRRYTDQEIIEEIDEGPSRMPAYRELLSEEEKRLIVEWLRLRYPTEAR
ncbi:MAG: cytochrome c [Myxococcota bacterium]|nr:cytochrome c [Myxococcota bacterium]